MDIREAISNRRSIRSFNPDPVPKEVLSELLERALRAPSWANTQPWELAIVSGKQISEIRRGFVQKAEDEPLSDIARPKAFPEPYNSRRVSLGLDLFKAKGIKREDREGRGWWRLQGLNNFGAPAIIYLCIERSLYYQGEGLNVWPVFDCGLVAENIMLLATGYGLGTIPQAQSVIFPDIIRKVLGMPESKLIVLGISVGYPNWDDPANQFRAPREQLSKIARWYGFD